MIFDLHWTLYSFGVTLGSDVDLSFDAPMHTRSPLQWTHHPPTPLLPVWDFWGCSNLALVICMGLFCFLYAFNEIKRCSFLEVNNIS